MSGSSLKIPARARYETSLEIKTPVIKRPPRFHEGGVVKLWGPMECGKTKMMIALVLRLLKRGYIGSDIYCNCWLNIPGSHMLRNDELKKVLRRALNTEIGEGRWNGKIFLIMEADGLYSHLTQTDKECFQDFRFASQCLKRNIWIFWETHDGKGVPKYLRDKTEISVRTAHIEQLDCINYVIVNGPYDYVGVSSVRQASAVNGMYRRFQELY